MRKSYERCYAKELNNEAHLVTKPELSQAQPEVIPACPVAILRTGLTCRELEILQYVARGLTNAQVAQSLGISSRTVDTHLTAIYGKPGVNSRSGATRYAFEQKIA